MFQNLEFFFVKNKVIFVLWGYVYRYERFCLLNNFICGIIGYLVYAVIGMAGQDWQFIWESRSDYIDMSVFLQFERSLYRGGEFGYIRFVVTKDKFTFFYVGNYDGEVYDMVEILVTGEVLSGGNGGEKVESGNKFEVKVEAG